MVQDLRTVGQRRSSEEADLIVAVRGLVERVTELERERRAERGRPLGRGSRALSRSVRLAAIGDIEVALGFSAWEAGYLVRAATAEEPLAAMVDAALRSGEVTWALVRLFYERTASLEDEQRLLAAAALFGADPELAAADRLDPDGELHGRAWSTPRYKAALEAEVVACRGTDVEAERAARARAYEARRMWVRVHDDGTATLSIKGPAASVLGAGQRLDRGARGVKAAGDPRTLSQLHADLGLGLLNFATVVLGTPPDNQAGQTTDAASTTGDTHGGHDATGDTDGAQGVLFDPVLAPDDMELLARVVNALPAVALQVVVPYSTVAGGFPICAHCSGPLDAPEPDDPAPGEDSALGGPPGWAVFPEHDERDGDGGPAPPRGDPSRRQRRRGAPPGRRGRGPVGEVLGANPFFVSEGHARELALMPGTTLHRLVVDPRDGRLVERTIQGYRPDA
ncbi:MAG: hypothetical protein DCC50_04155, partial [Acidobacteria bacterium]